MADQPPQGVIQLTAEQLQEIIAGALAQGQGQVGGGAGAAAAGNLPTCPLGWDKTKRFQQFQDWLTQVEAKMEFPNITEVKRKTAYLRSNAGQELTVFWQKEVLVRFHEIEEDAATGQAAQVAHTYKEKITLSKKEMFAMGRDQLVENEPGDKTAMEVVAATED